MPIPLSHSPSMPNNNTGARPRGLWKARGTHPPRLVNAPVKQPSISITNYIVDLKRFYTNEHDIDADADDSDCSTSSSCKRRRITESPPTSEEDSIRYWDYSRRCSPHPERLSNWTTRTKLMDTSSTAGPGQPSPDRTTCDLEDWEDLKELFSKAAEMYESETQESSEAMPLLRGVIHECNRIMLFYPDPSVLFASSPSRSNSPSGTPSAFEELSREWLREQPPLYPRPPRSPTADQKRSQGQQTSAPSTPPATTTTTQDTSEKDKKCKCVDLPTAFHAILGTALFLFGNLISQNPSLALQGEPTTPIPYWLSAIDVFETGENLPIRTSGRGCSSAPEDWRMAVVWGRTLLCIADEVLNRQKAGTIPPPKPVVDCGGLPDLKAAMAPGTADHPKWLPASPFGAIALHRPPITQRLSLDTVSVHELLILAQDQFSRGIFHMPHPQHSTHRYHHSTSSSTSSATTTSSSSTSYSHPAPASTTTSSQQHTDSFSRAKELFTMASEVLLISEKVTTLTERAHWAQWADSVFSQMKMEADTDAWRGPLNSARGRCCLIMGSARAEPLEEALEKRDTSVLVSEDADDAREDLGRAVAYLEKAREIAISQRQGGFVIVADGDDDGEGNVVNGVQLHMDGAEEGVEGEDDVEELTTLLVEALVTLANLTVDRKTREELYAQAEREGGPGAFDLEEDDEDRMDESG
ncbi:hypothetical protein B0H34DRAFT_702768 [Crassisporium funariophilum]|nr:hypothetical protein B0H34DRAFT_702768 [Crassisporium funariophilum]